MDRKLGWNRSGYLLASLFFLTLFVIGYVWYPLVEEYLALIDPTKPILPQLDWLLLGIFAFMTGVLMVGADLKRDAGIIFVGLVGGLVIESWGTQTELWTYYTNERPPLWIIPAWPIASLTIDRMVRWLDNATPKAQERVWKIAYWLIFSLFYVLLLSFTQPTFDKSFTIVALILCALITITPTDHRLAVITFAAGTGLGYFLERWGTTRLAWTYYTLERPPFFAVLAHGMAAVAFWRSWLLVKKIGGGRLEHRDSRR